jgi:hypothetical protein
VAGRGEIARLKPLRLRQSATIQKQKNRQSFFNFQENLNEYLPNLDVEASVFMCLNEKFKDSI